MDNNNKLPAIVTGLSKKPFGDAFVLDTMALTQEQVDAMCAVLQTAVGGKLEVREWSGTSRAGKKLPGYKLQVVTSKMVEDRVAYGLAQKASRGSTPTYADETYSKQLQDGDNAL